MYLLHNFTLYLEIYFLKIGKFLFVFVTCVKCVCQNNICQISININSKNIVGRQHYAL